MLTADLVRVMKRKGELMLPPFDARRRARAEEIARAYLELFAAAVGSSRDELEESLEAIEVDPRDRLLARGLKKLIEDRAEFDAESALEPELVRRVVFERAARVRIALGADEKFDRDRVLREAAEELGPAAVDVAAIEQALFADLRGAQLFRSLAPISAPELVAAYDVGRAQAVLLRAVRVHLEVECSSAPTYRALFRRMKFLRLLHTIEKNEDGGYTIEIDGPMSLFESVTKYGLELASLLPILEGCDRYSLQADVRWSGSTELLSFRTEGGTSEEEGTISPPELPEELATLVDRIRALDSAWTVEVASDILELPGVGLCIPDLVFTRADPPARVHLEVMGHWSRAAVWKRVELVERGLSTPIIFAVSTRLRVSEEALGDEAPAALYVYKGTMSAKGILEKVEEVASRKN